MKVLDANNEAGRLIAAGKLEEASRLLDEVERELASRAAPSVRADDLDPACDEYFYRVHRVVIGWHRATYAEVLPHAERAWELEHAMMAAVRKAGGDITSIAFSSGAWAIISVLTRCRRFEDAARFFERVVGDRDWLDARRRHNDSATARLLIAGLCVYFENKEPAWLASGRKIVERAYEAAWPEGAEIAYGFGCYWALVGDADRAFGAIEQALHRGFEAEKLLLDPDFQSLHADARWQVAVLGREIETSDRRLSLVREPEPLVPPRDLEQMRADGKRAPDEAARKKTRSFIGDRRRARVSVARGTTYGLGGLTIAVSGEGTATLHKLPWGERESELTHTVTLSERDMHLIFNAVVDDAFTEIVIGRHTGVPDELHFTIELTNDAGVTHRLSKFVSAEHERFDRLVQIVGGVVAGRLSAAERKKLTI